MKVSKSWLKELVNIKTSVGPDSIGVDEVVDLLPLRTIGTKEVTDKFFELDMKGYNRADLLSMRGVAREIAAITNSEITFKDIPVSEYVWVESVEDDEVTFVSKAELESLDVKVENNKLCPIYLLAKIEGIKVGASDKDWVEKLNDSGMRSINNIADITNLVMLEYGQPLHSFDAGKVKDQKIVVRTAKKGEKIKTLDNKERELEQTDIVIADEDSILGIAGVMGGKDSEITDDTSTILLEAAIFDPISIRKTSGRLNLTSEASKRFVHGLTITNLYQAFNKAIENYQKLGGKLTGIYISSTKLDQPKNVSISLSKISERIGVEITEDDVKNYLDKFHFRFSGHKKVGDDMEWIVTAPYWRLDIEIEADVIEEIARLYGYEKIPAKELNDKLPPKIDQSLFNIIRLLKTSLVDLGLTEIQSYSFYSTEVLDALGWDDSNKKYLVKVANPMSQETEYMRQDIWPNLVEIAVKNIRNGYDDIAIFEIGKIYLKKKDSQPEEKYYLSIALMNNTNNPIAELNSLYEKLMEIVPDISGKLTTEAGLPDDPIYKKLFHPTRFLSFKKGEEYAGGMAEVHPRIVNQLGSDKRIAVIEINLEPLLK